MKGIHSSVRLIEELLIRELPALDGGNLPSRIYTVQMYALFYVFGSRLPAALSFR